MIIWSHLMGTSYFFAPLFWSSTNLWWCIDNELSSYVLCWKLREMWSGLHNGTHGLTHASLERFSRHKCSWDIKIILQKWTVTTTGFFDSFVSIEMSGQLNVSGIRRPTIIYIFFYFSQSGIGLKPKGNLIHPYLLSWCAPFTESRREKTSEM